MQWANGRELREEGEKRVRPATARVIPSPNWAARPAQTNARRRRGRRRRHPQHTDPATQRARAGHRRRHRNGLDSCCTSLIHPLRVTNRRTDSEFRSVADIIRRIPRSPSLPRSRSKNPLHHLSGRCGASQARRRHSSPAATLPSILTCTSRIRRICRPTASLSDSPREHRGESPQQAESESWWKYRDKKQFCRHYTTKRNTAITRNCQLLTPATTHTIRHSFPGLRIRVTRAKFRQFTPFIRPDATVRVRVRSSSHVAFHQLPS